MPDTLLPPGEPISARYNEPRWFEPVLTAPDAAAPLPVGFTEFLVVPTPNPRRADAAIWREADWIGFVGAPESPAIAGDDAGDEATAAPAIAESVDEPQPAAAENRPAALTARLGVGIGRLLRLGGGAASVGVLAVFLYQGGERLAGFGGAPPPPPAAIAARLQPAAPAVAPNQPPARAVPPDSAASRFLDLAVAGEPAAQYDLAVLYASGTGVAQDPGAAASWFREAALAGNLPAAFNLGVMYERGIGVAPDMDEAVSWYRRAAARYYPAAEYNLALAYAEGRGTPQDWVAAARWYRQAALQQVVAAMVNFAILCETGEGIERSLPDAYAWYRAAARRGDTEAEKRSRDLFQQLAGVDKGRAVMLAASVADALQEPAPAAPPAAVGAAGQTRAAPRPASPAGGSALRAAPGARQPPG